MAENKPELNEALLRALHEMGESATPEQLAAAGVTRVRRVSREMVSRLIEKAVNRTLVGRTVGVSEPELRGYVAKAHAEFNRIVGQQDQIDRTRQQVGDQRVALKEELARIREELAARRGFLETQASRGRLELEERENEQLAARMRETLEKSERLQTDPRRTEHELIACTLEALESARASAYAAGREQAGQQTQLLERRVAKLVHSLEATEQELRRISAQALLPQGIGSIYRSVQGLSAAEQDAETKRALMTDIFEKNLELHERRRTAAGAKNSL